MDNKISKLYTSYKIDKRMKTVKRCKIPFFREKDKKKAYIGLKNLTSVDFCS